MTLYTVTSLNGSIKFHSILKDRSDVVIESGEVIEVIDNKIQQSGEI